MSDGSRREGSWKQDLLHGFVFFHYLSPASSGPAVKVERWDKGKRIGDGATERASEVAGGDHDDVSEEDGEATDTDSTVSEERYVRSMKLDSVGKPQYLQFPRSEGGAN